MKLGRVTSGVKSAASGFKGLIMDRCVLLIASHSGVVSPRRAMTHGVCINSITNANINTVCGNMYCSASIFSFLFIPEVHLPIFFGAASLALGQWNNHDWYEWIRQYLIMIKHRTAQTGIILCMLTANGRRRYIVLSSRIRWVHTQKIPAQTHWMCCT